MLKLWPGTGAEKAFEGSRAVTAKISFWRRKCCQGFAVASGAWGRERETSLCLDNCNPEGQIIMGWLFIDTGWAAGLIPNKDTTRERGSSRFIQTQPHRKELAWDVTAVCSQCHPPEWLHFLFLSKPESLSPQTNRSPPKLLAVYPAREAPSPSTLHT